MQPLVPAAKNNTMSLPVLCLSFTLSLLPTTVAHAILTRSSTTTVPDISSIKVANIVIYALFLFVTTVQLGFSSVSSPHAQSQWPSHFRLGDHHSSRNFAVSFALGLADVIKTSIASVEVSDVGRSLVNIYIVEPFFFAWSDPAVFVAVALVLRDRYRTCSTNLGQKNKHTTPLLPFTITSCILAVLMFALATSYAAVLGSTKLSEFSLSDREDFTNLFHLIDASNSIFYAYIALYICGSIFLVAFAIVVERAVRVDKVHHPHYFPHSPLSDTMRILR